MATKYKIPKKAGFGQLIRPTNNVIGAPRAPEVAYTPPTSQASGVTLGAQAPGPTTPDIRDPSYWLNIANIDEYYGTSRAQYGEQRRQDVESRDRALTILGQKEPEDIRKAEEGANKAGLFYSGILGRDKGDIATGYARQRDTIGADFTGRENLRQIGEASNTTQYGPDGIKYREAIQAAADRTAQWNIDHPPTPAAATPVAQSPTYAGTPFKAPSAAVAKAVAAAAQKKRKSGLQSW